ncbi:MAG TPA: histidine kinase [Gaiellaceae bacterium]
MTASAFAPRLDAVTARVPPGPWLSWTIAICGGVGAATSFALAVIGEGVGVEMGEPLVIAVLTALMTLSYVTCGLFAWRRRPDTRFGPLMITAGFMNFLATLVWSRHAVPHTLGQALDFLPPVLFLHVYLAFPDGRLKARAERVLLGIAYVTAVTLELTRMYFGGFGANNLLEGHTDLAAGEVVRNVQLTIISVCCLVGVGLLAARRWEGGRPRRRPVVLIVDAFAIALVMMAFLFLSVAYGGPWTAQIRWATFAAVALGPIVFLTGLLHARLARSALADLMVELPRELAPADLRNALARTLRDPSLELVYWLPEYDTYADVDGQAVQVAELGRGRATTVIEWEGKRVGALLHDSSLNDEQELLGAVTAAAGIAVENARLQAELRAGLNELQGSRARVIEAGQKERQRLERNLHDGAQQRLIALSLRLSLLERKVADDPHVTAQLNAARREIAQSLEELRDVARGLHPAVLSGHGLTVAVESLAARAPLPVRLRLDVGRLPDLVEVSAYYVVSESLANVAKHARASVVDVSLARTAGGLVVEVVDDGVGGADTEQGSGLRGLADRVEALGGRLRVWTPLGGGTRVQAEIPCA